MRVVLLPLMVCPLPLMVRLALEKTFKLLERIVVPPAGRLIVSSPLPAAQPPVSVSLLAAMIASGKLHDCRLR